MQMRGRPLRGGWVRWVPAALAIICVCVSLSTPSSATTASRSSGGGSWPTYHGNVMRTGYTTDTSISVLNAGQLHQSWDVSVKASISAQPVVNDAAVYWGDWKGFIHATTVAGKALWTTSLGTTRKPPGCIYDLASQGILSTPTLGTIGGRRVVWAGGGRGQMVALDASNGKIVWKTDLRTAQGNSIWSSPAYYDGSIYVGVASFQGCPPVFGRVVRLNAATGAIQAVLNFSSLVPAKCRELGAWSSPAVDPAENAIFIGTSNDFCKSRYQDAILRLNPKTLQISSLWQVPASQHPSDSDFGATPMLFSATIGGVTRQLVGAVNKNGVYYVLDREDLAAGPVWTYVAAKAGTLASQACGNVDAISSSAWTGPGSPVMVAGLTNSGSSCIGTLAALNPSNGQPDWRILLAGSVEGALTEVPGIVAVGAGPTADLISSATGQILFSYTEASKSQPKGGVGYGAPTGEFWAPPTIAGNTLYTANQDGSFRAFSP
jgi:polyvinyl alcohol dehydrogenase (cytochrome)